MEIMSTKQWLAMLKARAGKGGRKKPCHPEEDMQVACVRWFAQAHPLLEQVLNHAPNGGKRNAREGARFKAMGTRAGFPDLFLYVPAPPYHGLAVELKSEKGKQSAAQRQWQQYLEHMGYRYELVRELEQFKAVVEDYLAGGANTWVLADGSSVTHTWDKGIDYGTR